MIRKIILCLCLLPVLSFAKVESLTVAGDFYTMLENQGSKPAVVLFTANWCGPCKAQAPVYESLSKTMTSMSFYKIDVDGVPSIPQKYQVVDVPTYIVFKQGKLVDRRSGAMSKSELETWFNKIVKKS